MSTIQDRATQLLYNEGCGSGVTVHYIARRLADAGLLAPDLPEPEMDLDRLIWRVDEEGFVYRKPDGRISTVGVGNPYPNMEIARRHALAVLAATNHYATKENS